MKYEYTSDTWPQLVKVLSFYKVFYLYLSIVISNAGEYAQWLIYD